MGVHHLALRTITLLLLCRRLLFSVLSSHHSASGSMDYAQLLSALRSGRCVSCCDKKALWNLIWAAGGFWLRRICRNPTGITFQTTCWFGQNHGPIFPQRMLTYQAGMKQAMIKQTKVASFAKRWNIRSAWHMNRQKQYVPLALPAMAYGQQRPGIA